MENQTINITAQEGTQTIRLVQQEAEPERYPSAVRLITNIFGPYEYISGNVLNLDDIVVLADYSARTINATINKYLPQPDVITGVLSDHSYATMLPINKEEKFSAKELGNLLKKHKFLFFDENEYNGLIPKLLRFSAKVQTAIENSSAQDGSKRDLLDIQVSKDVPSGFMVKFPLFTGGEEYSFWVDIYAEATTNQVYFSLESIDMIVLQKRIADNMIKGQIDIIKGHGCVCLER